MASFTTDLREWKDFYADLMRHLQGGYVGALQAGGDRAGLKLDELVRTTLPPAKQSSGPNLHTDKQRRWWWATMHAKAKGKSRALPGWKAVYRVVEGRKTLVISGHYKRTGKLMQSMTWETLVQGDTVTVRYGTNRVYGPFVVGDPEEADRNKRQAVIHRGNWTPLHVIAQQHLPAINDEFIAGATEVIRRDLGA